MSITPDMQVHRTNDLALATYLRTKGVRHFTMDLIEFPDSGRRDQAEWVYTMTPRLQTLLDDYHKGDALVEPRKYSVSLRQVRQELYTFLDLEDPEP